MLIDGLKLTEYGKVVNTKVESGETLPSVADEGADFILTAAYDVYTPGMYYYMNAEWHKVGAVEFSFDNADFETAQVGNVVIVTIDYTKVASRTYVNDVVANLPVRTYVDGQDAATLASAKSYTDSAVQGVVQKTYVDAQDAATLASANSHADTAAANAQQAAQAYADAIAQQLDPKASVRLATTADITLSGAQTIDGRAVADGDRILVKNQNDGTKNGIYIASTSGSWARATDANTSSKVTTGLTTTAEDGDSNAGTTWLLVTKNVTLGTSSLSFTLFGQSVAVDNVTLNKVNNTLSINAAYTPYDIASCVLGMPNPGAASARLNIVRSFKLPAGLSGSKITSEVAATADAVFLILKNGTQIGAFTFAAGAVNATVSFASAITFAVGDKLTIMSPDTQDATLSDVTFTFMGNLQ